MRRRNPRTYLPLIYDIFFISCLYLSKGSNTPKLSNSYAEVVANGDSELDKLSAMEREVHADTDI